METVNVTKRSNQMELSYETKESGRKLGKSGEWLARVQKSAPYAARCGIIIEMDGMTWAADVGVHRSSTASSSLRLVSILKLSTMKIFLDLVCEVFA